MIRSLSENMEVSSDSELSLTPPEILENAKLASLNLLPEKSKKKYEIAYHLFMNWRSCMKTSSFSESVLMAYFAEKSKVFKPTTLWTQYSMLRTTLSINDDVDISKYIKLRVFLKRQSDGYRPKKSKIFTSQEINNFIKDAPDDEFLMTKVALIIGIMGACRRHELHQMKIDDLNDLGSALVIKIPDTKTKIVRNFTITGKFHQIIKKYTDLRPLHVKDSSFFLNYQKGKCTIQKVGINKFGSMGKSIAKFLKLPDAELYTGHCFRRSSATILVDAGGDITSLKRHGGWKSTAVAEGYIDESMKNKFDVENRIRNSIENRENLPSTSKAWKNQENLTVEIESNKSPNITVSHCGNVTFNIINNK